VEISKGGYDECNKLREELPGSQMGTTMNGGGRDARFVDLFVCVVVSRVSNEENQPSSFLRTTVDNSRLSSPQQPSS
jgi:hypothetical protein